MNRYWILFMVLMGGDVMWASQHGGGDGTDTYLLGTGEKGAWLLSRQQDIYGADSIGHAVGAGIGPGALVWGVEEGT